MLEGIFDASQASAFIQIVLIDIVMSGDNAIIIGMAAAGLPPELRKKAIFWGIIGATVLRIFFAVIVVQLLAIIGIKVVGGLLLLWVCWRMWQEIRAGVTVEDMEREADEKAQKGPPKTMRMAMINIIVADATMSLDNVLAVAGAARDHLEMLIFGLVLSIALMALTANFIAKLLEKHSWLGYLGLAIIAYVAVQMLWQGSAEVYHATSVYL
jgi:YjbE family integral membrane protein